MLLPNIQRELRLHRPYRAVLVQLDSAMAHLGAARECVLNMVDAGELRWVWNVATAGERRELRFWAGTSEAPGELRERSLAGITFDEAVRRIVGREHLAEIRSVTVGDILIISRQQMLGLMRTGALQGHVTRGVGRFILRDSLVEFLRNRWMGR